MKAMSWDVKGKKTTTESRRGGITLELAQRAETQLADPSSRGIGTLAGVRGLAAQLKNHLARELACQTE